MTLARWMKQLPRLNETTTLEISKIKVPVKIYMSPNAKPTLALVHLEPKPNKALLHHGTTAKCALFVAQKIKFQNARPNLDFGPGFYLTESFEQAVRWAQTRQDGPSNQGAVVTFCLTPELSALYRETAVLTDEMTQRVVRHFRYDQIVDGDV